MWDEQVRALLAFREIHGHIDVPRRWPENPALSNWVINQRRQIRLGTLPAARLRTLESLGIQWKSAEERTRDRDRRWNRMCDALHAFLRRHGHCDVPGGWRENPELASWVVRQRHLMRVGTLRADRLLRFEERGIDWSLERGRSRARDRVWDRLFHALREFRRASGHCNVPKGWRENPKLARWVTRQRAHLRRGILRGDRRSLLEELGLQPAPLLRRGRDLGQSGSLESLKRGQIWMKHYCSLERFHALHGHSDVPRRYAADPALARWISYQRQRRRQHRLPVARIAMLDRLSFSWSGGDAVQRERSSTWEHLFARLVAYRSEHGDCDVPSRWETDAALGRWVATQRMQRIRGRLESAREARLTRLGFNWRSRDPERIGAAL